MGLLSKLHLVQDYLSVTLARDGFCVEQSRQDNLFSSRSHKSCLQNERNGQDSASCLAWIQCLTFDKLVSVWNFVVQLDI